MRYLVGLIGSGIGASGSPALHETEARALGVHVHYQLIDLVQPALVGVPLPEILRAAEKMGFSGVNVTHPSKQAVISFLHELSDEARAIGAVNTVVFSGGRRIGHNTDCYGFAESLRRGLPDADLEWVLLLGAGGAGSAVAQAALEAGVRHLSIVDAQPSRALGLAGKLRAQFRDRRIEADVLAHAMEHAGGLIHATPTGMADHPGIAVDPYLLRSEMWVADIVYFPLETELLREARARGCRTLNGAAMAVFQAARAFQLFTGIEPDPERMLASFNSPK